MKGLFVLLATIVAAAGVSIAGCAPAAPAPTQAPAAPPTKAAEPAKPTAASTKAAEPAKAPTAAPTAAPKVDYPGKGKTVNIIVPFAAGGTTDTGARILAATLEKDLGASFPIVNKPGAGSQTGLTDIAKAKPDGYIIGAVNLPAVITIYLDPERKASFTRKDFEPIALHVVDPGAVAVRTDSPFKTMKDLIDAAKARPGEIRTASAGILNPNHLAALDIERKTGAKFTIVQFDGGAPSTLALLGGHVETYIGSLGDFGSALKAGQIRLLGLMDKEENPLAPGVPTLESQGLKVYINSSRGFTVPRGTPKEIVDTLRAAMKKAIADEEQKKKMWDAGLVLRYMDAPEYAKYWEEYEALTRELMVLAGYKPLP